MPSSERNAEFVELIAQHQGQIYGFICALVRNRDDAQDILQQTLLVLWQKFSQFQPGTNFLSWAFQVSQIEARRFRSVRRSTGVQLSEELLSLVAQSMVNEAQEDLFQARKGALAECLRKLSEHDHQLVNEVYGSRKRVNDIAVEAGRIPQSVTNSLRRIRRRLFDCIERSVTKAKWET
jgi:RNA polymerase sigma-70 factor (ECF subfamily)